MNFLQKNRQNQKNITVRPRNNHYGRGEQISWIIILCKTSIDIDVWEIVKIYEKHIKDIFKKAIDIAAEVTKDRNPQLSIMFDGIGLILADDVNEAIKKVFSILDKANNPVGEMR